MRRLNLFIFSMEETGLVPDNLYNKHYVLFSVTWYVYSPVTITCGSIQANRRIVEFFSAVQYNKVFYFFHSNLVSQNTEGECLEVPPSTSLDIATTASTPPPPYPPWSSEIHLPLANSQRQSGICRLLQSTPLARRILSPEHELAALLNRSLANLRLQWPQKALLDAICARDNGTTTVEGLFREAMAYCALEQFGLCAERLQQVLALNHGNKDVEKGLERTTRKYMQNKLFYAQQQQQQQ
ncbi:hypothetical protein CTA2_2734 [Colletotrichum tanaceti]|uniref:Uncharacterized protein n=1 Tax=Colletotrichum tanaceti TaxID=1306861 RepID=A0A4U6X238_9PEZI|nr:hypothetical protein CTA2_2734 [Colletotrichum tanaceti]TKW48819.1 hypothetical protein CTA1_1494 [Colletotrichum tanaceti]